MVITASRVVAVEGVDEIKLIGAFLKYCGIEGVQIISFGGKSRLRRQLPGIVRAPGFDRVRRFAVVRDADDDAEAAFASVRDALAAAGLPAVDAPCVPNGGSDLRITVVIMPPNSPRGALEHLCLESVAGHPAARCVDQFVACAAEVGGAPNNASKAKVQAFLAVQQEPGKRLGEAGEAGYWRFQDDAFRPLGDCLKAALL